VKEFLERDKSSRLSIVVVGDAMLDEYYEINAERISPEYPIPVELSENENPYLIMPGGAANVANQMKSFNVEVTLVCFSDMEATSILNKFDFNLKAVPIEQKIPRKQRYYHGTFPLRRRDIEKPYGKKSYRDSLFETFKHHVSNTPPDIVILSDYNKGIFNYDEDYMSQRLVKLCQQKGIPVVVDPKSGPLKQWKGCDIFKPNLKEAREFGGKDQIIKALPGTQVVITQGGNSVIGNDWEYKGKKVITESVIGAGDCYSAFLAMAYARGFSVEESAGIAYQASAYYVSQRHNKPPQPRDLLDPLEAKFIDLKDLEDRDYKLAFTNGVFDVLHLGHLEILKFAKSKADKLIVAVDTDESVKKIKGENRPINVLDYRMKMLAHLDYVDFVVAFHTDNLYNLIKSLKPEVLVKGGDWKPEAIIGNDIVAEVYHSPLIEGLSTTNLIEKIKNELT
jgi:D-beta-D-heptose 7-phosphate kinase/D-beta-D-heptose 1-phosphate adenosyltransferase